MAIPLGAFISFSAYLEGSRLPSEQPAVWHGADIWRAAARQPADARGAVAFTRGAAGNATEIVPGISLTAQRVEAGMRAGLHRHSFWHLYHVAGGSGHVILGDESNRVQVTAGDWLFVPAWHPHAVDNRAGTAPLDLFALQNLPHCAALGNLARADERQSIELTYADA
ncbi:cupin domain-containing protein [Trinickia diaoshuihuensis]|uniref:cupin domain-containing protein n=1 Tax=Trinickia diaoshuihuensis TaxID=2292265 RepID=UPI000E22A90C|nr:cupin domain-containing protein [Trinickia diaoshuihuensis]